MPRLFHSYIEYTASIQGMTCSGPLTIAASHFLISSIFGLVALVWISNCWLAWRDVGITMGSTSCPMRFKVSGMPRPIDQAQY